MLRLRCRGGAESDAVEVVSRSQTNEGHVTSLCGNVSLRCAPQSFEPGAALSGSFSRTSSSPPTASGKHSWGIPGTADKTDKLPPPPPAILEERNEDTICCHRLEARNVPCTCLPEQVECEGIRCVLKNNQE